MINLWQVFKRLHLGGVETILYRIAIKLNFLNFFKRKVILCYK